MELIFEPVWLIQISPQGAEDLLTGPSGQQGVSIFVEAVKLFLILLAPFVTFAVIIHWFERITQRRMSERFGWRSVLWTGWLGTPIHELSHALMCRVFQHRIVDMALFEPDRESGRLGFVNHSFKAGNWFQELGNFFIGIAPLMGGSVVLAGLLWIFYPDAASSAIETAHAYESGQPIQKTIAIASALCEKIVSVEHLATARFWTFTYLVLCVGSHMAPSGSDYHGALRGVLFVGAILIATVFLLAALGTTSQKMIDGMIAILGPLFAVLGLTIVLCGLTTGLVYLVTSFFPKRYTVS